MSADEAAKLIGAVAAAVVVVLGAIGALYVKIHSVGVQVNGRMTELLELTRKAAYARGQLEQLPQGGQELDRSHSA